MPERVLDARLAERRHRSSLAITADGSNPPCLRLQGELDLSNVEDLWVCLESAISTSAGDVALDLSELTFIDSSGVAQFIRAVRLLGLGRRLVLDRPSRSVCRVIDITGLAAIPGIWLRAPT